ncbi:MAG: hypothetical protein PVF68_05610 [Acidobacteriota bacterium]|jgi:hypothetical protein
MSRSTSERAFDLLQRGELAEAIAAFLGALEEDPERVESYFGLMRAYELAYEVFPDPELLHQVENVLRGLRDLDLGPEEHRRADGIASRIAAKLADAGHPLPIDRGGSPGGDHHQ